jgi:type II secretory pathway pseudopilin PulG
LLVVVGIIAILIAILLPSLQRARHQARIVSCLSNMRQTISALHMYAAQYKDFPWNVRPGYDIRGLVFSEHSGQIWRTPEEIAMNPSNAPFTDASRQNRYQLDGQCEVAWWLYYLIQGNFLKSIRGAGCAFEVPDGWDIQYIRQIGQLDTPEIRAILPNSSTEWRKYPAFTYTGPAVIDDYRVNTYSGGQIAPFGYPPGGNGGRSGAHYPRASTKRRAIIMYCSVWSVKPYDGRDNYMAPHLGIKSLRNRSVAPMSLGGSKLGHMVGQTIGFNDGSAIPVQQPVNSNLSWWVNARGEVTTSTESFQLSPN